MKRSERLKKKLRARRAARINRGEKQLKQVLFHLKNSVLRKKDLGLALTPAEAHLVASMHEIAHMNFGPSPLGVILRIARDFLQPLIVLAFYAVLLFTIVSKTRAFLTRDVDVSIIEATDPYAAALNIPENYSAQQLAALAASSRFEPLQANSEPEKRSQIEFICGIISVYRPTIKNCGTLARDIIQVSLQEKVDPFYVAAIISVESRFSPSALSHKGARGLMQLLPETGREVHRTKTGKPRRPDLHDTKTNIALGVTYIKQLERQYRGNRYLALAAYNWGPTNVARAGRNKDRIPNTVRRYAATILEKTLRWRRQYQNAVDSATEFAEQGSAAKGKA